MEVVINKCFGGFGLSIEATLRLYELGCESIEIQTIEDYYGDDLSDNTSSLGYKKQLKNWKKYLQTGEEGSLFTTIFTPDEKSVISSREISRDDPLLIQVIRELGDRANGLHANLQIIDIPDNVKWHVSEYDGNEHIEEVHRTWR